MKRSLALVITTLLLAGCGGGGSSSVAPASQAKTQSATASVTLVIPGGGSSQTSGKVRYPQFVSPNANSVEMSVNGGADQTFNVASNSSLCTTTAGGGRTCTLTFGAPAGSDTFAFEIFSGANGSGSLLAQATTTQTIAATGAFNFSIGLDAVVGTVVANVQTQSGTQGTCPNGPMNFNGVNEGCPGSVPATISVYDPSGALVTGTAPYATPIVLSASDPSLSISPSTVTTPGTPITLSYNGAALAPATTTTVTVTITVGSTQIPTTIPVAHSYLYVANANVTPGNLPTGGGNIAVYTFGASGNATPARLITGGSTNLYDPVVPRVDSLGNLYVLDNGSSGTNPVINIYPPGATGNVTPRQISAISAVDAGRSCEQMQLDQTQTHLWVTCDDFALHVFTIPTLTSTTASAAQTVSYNDDSWEFPEGLAFDNSGGIYVSDVLTNAIYYYTIASLPTSGIYNAINSSHIMNGGTSWPATNEPLGVGVDDSGTLYAEIVYFNSTSGAPDATNMIAQWSTATIPCSNCLPSGELTGAPFTTHAPTGFTIDYAGNGYSGNAFTNTITEFSRATMVSGGTGTVNNPATLRVLTTTASGANAPTGLAIGP